MWYYKLAAEGGWAYLSQRQNTRERVALDPTQCPGHGNSRSLVFEHLHDAFPGLFLTSASPLWSLSLTSLSIHRGKVFQTSFPIQPSSHVIGYHVELAECCKLGSVDLK